MEPRALSHTNGTSANHTSLVSSVSVVVDGTINVSGAARHNFAALDLQRGDGSSTKLAMCGPDTGVEYVDVNTSASIRTSCSVAAIQLAFIVNSVKTPRHWIRLASIWLKLCVEVLSVSRQFRIDLNVFCSWHFCQCRGKLILVGPDDENRQASRGGMANVFVLRWKLFCKLLDLVVRPRFRKLDDPVLPTVQFLARMIVANDISGARPKIAPIDFLYGGRSFCGGS
mmetsp:Transcript_72974/g.128882  ORF Transcript_72974/g.128882 Transcript_72974/m.128882 type:complete len:227 (-) Transcript_72974:1898-2578(-)